MASPLHEGDDGGETAKKWEDQLSRYLDSEDPVIARLRARTPPNDPWPETDNPVFAYLLERAIEIEAGSDMRTALIWLASHCWFEGSLQARSKMLLAMTKL